MGLVLKLKYGADNDGSECDKIYIEDDTGVYDATTNTGGYQAESGDASGNPKRSELALYQLLTKKSRTTDSDITYTNDDTAAGSVTKWSVDVTTDGWYRSQVIAFPVWDSTTAYGVNQLVYFSTSLYKCIVTTSAGESPSSAPTKWEAYQSTTTNLRTVYDNISTYSPTTTIYTAYLDFAHTCYSNKIYGDAWKDVSDNSPSFYDTKTAIKITAFLEGAKISAARSNFADADDKLMVVLDLGENPNSIKC